VNLSLLSRPTRVKAGTKTVYIYAPAEVTTNEKMKVGTAIRVLGVFPGDTPSETTLRIISADDMEQHSRYDCHAYYTARERSDRSLRVCDCECKLSEMSDDFKGKVRYVLLADIGK
jgi:hypothetical protein